MTLRLKWLVLFAAAALAVHASALGGTPYVSPQYQITDASIGQDEVNCEVSNMVRIDNSLYFIYRNAKDPSNPNNPENFKPYIRKFNLGTLTFADPPVVAGLADLDQDHRFYNPDYSEGSTGYHYLPTLLRYPPPPDLSSAGGLIAITPAWWQREQCLYQPGNPDVIPGWFRLIPDAASLQTWTYEGGLPSRVHNDVSTAYCPYCGASHTDIMGVYDDRTRTTYFAGEGTKLRAYNGEPDSEWPGLHRIFYRVTNDGDTDGIDDFDGPYILVKATWPEPSPQLCGGGNIFTKGDLVLGKEATGPRSLHVIWNIRNTFKVPSGSPPACSSSSHLAWLNYNLYYAKSTDGGTTWRNVNGEYPVDITAQGNHLGWNDAHYLAYEGDVLQSTERAFDVDSNGYPVIAVIKWHPGTGQCIDTSDSDGLLDVCGTNPPEDVHVDWNGGQGDIRYDLVCRRWNGSTWVTHDIDTSGIPNFKDCNVRLRVDKANRIWVFVGNPPWWSQPGDDYNMRYKVSNDGGETWSAWQTFTTVNTTWSKQLYSYADPVDPNWHYLAFTVSGASYGHQINFVRTKLTGPEIVTQPTNQTVYCGQSAVFSVDARGLDLSYQWRKDGVPIEGATGASYTVTSAQESADYDVVITESGISERSATAHLTVTTPWVQRSLSTQPTARREHAMAFDSTRGVTVLFGGDVGYASADTWEWNGTNWTEAEADPDFDPCGRYGHAMTFRGNVVLFGGIDSEFTWGDTWEWDGYDWCETTTSGGPSARAYCGFANDCFGEALVFGGYDTGPLNDLWGYYGGWDEFGAGLPSARYKHAMTSESCIGDPGVIFGGLTGGDILNGETWTFALEDGMQQFTPNPCPSARCSSAIVKTGYKTAILFGGQGASGLLGDTWRWDGTTGAWTLLCTCGPAPRKGHAMVYDSARNVIVLFGGETASGLSDETWELDLNP